MSGYNFLDNFYEAPMIVNGIRYRNLEAVFQSFKTNDLEERKSFSDLTGAEAREKGHNMPLPSGWDAAKDVLMMKLLRLKFQRSDLLEKLMLIEGPIVNENDYGDTYWGVCNGQGQNKLGQFLTTIKDEALSNAYTEAKINLAEIISEVEPDYPFDVIYDNKIEVLYDWAMNINPKAYECIPYIIVKTGALSSSDRVSAESLAPDTNNTHVAKKTLAFTGHRPNDINSQFGYDTHNLYWIEVKERTKQEIRANGIEKVITGMALGYDQAALEAAIDLKNEGYPLEIEAAVPFKGQERIWPKASQNKYNNLLKQCDTVHICYDEESKNMSTHDIAVKLNERNHYMVNSADMVLAFWNGNNGGTGNTVKYAKDNGKPVSVINPDDVVASFYPKKKALAFTGHRPNSLPSDFGYDLDSEAWVNTKNAVKNGIRNLGAERIYTGMALGFDQVVCKAGIELKNEGYPLEIVAAIPFKGQERIWPKVSQDLYNNLLNQCDMVHICYDKDSQDMTKDEISKKLDERNHYMIDNAGMLGAFHIKGVKGGTLNAIDYAANNGKQVFFLDPNDILTFGALYVQAQSDGSGGDNPNGNGGGSGAAAELTLEYEDLKENEDENKSALSIGKAYDDEDEKFMVYDDDVFQEELDKLQKLTSRNNDDYLNPPPDGYDPDEDFEPIL